MQFNGMQISWRYVRDLYDMTLKSEGLTCLPKLRFEHVNLTAFSKMRVDLAAQVRTKQNYYKALNIIVQVLSSSISNAIKTFLQPEAAETAHFIDKFDKFFDLLNVTNYSSSYKSLKPFKAPYRWSADKRLQVCLA